MNLKSYLTRIGLDEWATSPPGPTVSTLKEVHRAHITRVPFENLDLHRQEKTSISLDPREIYHKLVHEGRGGVCFELNSSLSWLLQELGFEAHLVGAQVCEGNLGSQIKEKPGEETWTALLCHVVVIVKCVDSPVRWAADVGFGNSGVEPLSLEEGLDQDVPPSYRFRTTKSGNVYFREKYFEEDGAYGRLLKWEDVYVELGSFERAREWIEEGSLFAFDLICNLMRNNGRKTLTGNTFFIEETDKGKIVEEKITSQMRLEELLNTEFGIQLKGDNPIKPVEQLTPFGSSMDRRLPPKSD